MNYPIHQNINYFYFIPPYVLFTYFVVALCVIFYTILGSDASLWLLFIHITDDF